MSKKNNVIRGSGFHHISISVKSLERSRKFYSELGFAERFSWGKEPKKTLLMDIGDGNYFEISGGGSDAPKPEGIFLHLALRTTDCETAVERARAAGAEITVEPKDVMLPSVPPTPVRIAFFKGPDGELIELFQNEAT